MLSSNSSVNENFTLYGNGEEATKVTKKFLEIQRKLYTQLRSQFDSKIPGIYTNGDYYGVLILNNLNRKVAVQTRK